jgi:hypothetical protein
MKRALLGLLAAPALSLGLAVPAWAAPTTPGPICAGDTGSSLAGQPGARADLIFESWFPDSAAYGLPLGALQSESSQFHVGYC